MHIQVDAERLKYVYENREDFLANMENRKQLFEYMKQWQIFSKFPIEPNTTAILNYKEYYVLCKAEEYFGQDVISLE